MLICKKSKYKHVDISVCSVDKKHVKKTVWTCDEYRIESNFSAVIIIKHFGKHAYY